MRTLTISCCLLLVAAFAGEAKAQGKDRSGGRDAAKLAETDAMVSEKSAAKGARVKADVPLTEAGRPAVTVFNMKPAAGLTEKGPEALQRAAASKDDPAKAAAVIRAVPGEVKKPAKKAKGAASQSQ